MTHRALGLAAALLLTTAHPAPAEEAPAQAIHYELPGPVPLLAIGGQLREAVPILLTDDRLSPRRAVVHAGQTVRWRSMARHASRIVFEREIARAMVCHSLVNFAIDGDQLRSGPLETGDTSSFCRLDPGTYRYRIVRSGPAERPTTGARQLSSRLEGVIVVLPDEPGRSAAEAVVAR